MWVVILNVHVWVTILAHQVGCGGQSGVYVRLLPNVSSQVDVALVQPASYPSGHCGGPYASLPSNGPQRLASHPQPHEPQPLTDPCHVTSDHIT